MNSNTASHTVHAVSSVSPAPVVKVRNLAAKRDDGAFPYRVITSDGTETRIYIGYGYTPRQARESLALSLDIEVLSVARATKEDVRDHA